jgi:hypothetical protein
MMAAMHISRCTTARALQLAVFNKQTFHYAKAKQREQLCNNYFLLQSCLLFEPQIESIVSVSGTVD